MHIGFVGQPLTDVASETRSAAIGGVTSILNYVLKADDYEPHYREFVDHIDRLAYVDMGIHLGIFTPEQIDEIPRYIDGLRRHLVQVLHELQGRRGVQARRRATSTTGCSSTS